MNYSSLEDAYGTPFGQRVPITHERKDAKPGTVEQPDFASMAKKSDEAIKRNKDLIEAVKHSLPLDKDPNTESFRIDIEEPAPVKRLAVRETFTSPPQVESKDDKISRILRLIEQNRTGYERPATQDMVLYVFTGVFFLFTLDTFVLLGKSMRGK